MRSTSTVPVLVRKSEEIISLQRMIRVSCNRHKRSSSSKFPPIFPRSLEIGICFSFSIAQKHANFSFGYFNWMVGHSIFLSTTDFIQFALCLLVCWTLTAGGLLKGVQSMGKVALVTTFLPYSSTLWRSIDNWFFTDTSSSRFSFFAASRWMVQKWEYATSSRIPIGQSWRDIRYAISSHWLPNSEDQRSHSRHGWQPYLSRRFPCQSAADPWSWCHPTTRGRIPIIGWADHEFHSSIHLQQLILTSIVAIYVFLPGLHHHPLRGHFHVRNGRHSGFRHSRIDGSTNKSVHWRSGQIAWVH